jgi:putative ABC transport system permease protein
MLMTHLRQAVRVLRKDRTFTAMTLLVLAFGLGANVAVFTIVNAVLLPDLPFDPAGRMVHVASRVDNRDSRSSYVDVEDWRAARTLRGLAVYTDATMNLAEPGRSPERLLGTHLSGNALPLLALQPALGRVLGPDDDRAGAAPVAVISHELWRARYGSDPGVIGRSVRINGVPNTIVGVMPDGFQFPQNTRIWQPLAALPGAATMPREARLLEVFGLLADGATVAQADADISRIAAALRDRYAETNKGVHTRVVPYAERYVGGDLSRLLLSLLGAVGFVLLIACANIANLLLTRSAARAPEVALRLAVGARRRTIAGQLLVESLLLAGIGGILGLAVAMGGIRLFKAAIASTNPPPPSWVTFTFDVRVFAFVATITLVAGVLFALVPMVYASRTDVRGLLNEQSRGASDTRRTSWWAGVLVTAELALTIVLLAGATLMMRSFLTLYGRDPGVATDRLLTMRMELPPTRYPTPADRAAFVDRVVERFGAQPAVAGVTVTNAAPSFGGLPTPLLFPGRPVEAGRQPPTVTLLAVTDAYFSTLGLSLHQGRAFTPGDGTPGREVAIVNERFVAMFFGNEAPLDQSVQVTTAPGPRRPPVTVRIIGVAPNVSQLALYDSSPDPVVYIPYRLAPMPGPTLLVRSRDATPAVTAQARSELARLDPDLPLFDVQPLDTLIASLRWPQRVFGGIFVVLATIGLMVSTFGLYGVASHSVAQRTHEIGVRVVHGAQAPQITWLVVRRILLPLVAGAVAGVAGASALSPALQSMLVPAAGSNTRLLIGVAAFLICVGLVAIIVPTRRALVLDPVESLRSR